MELRPGLALLLGVVWGAGCADGTEIGPTRLLASAAGSSADASSAGAGAGGEAGAAGAQTGGSGAVDGATAGQGGGADAGSDAAGDSGGGSTSGGAAGSSGKGGATGGGSGTGGASGGGGTTAGASGTAGVAGAGTGGGGSGGTGGLVGSDGGDGGVTVSARSCTQLRDEGAGSGPYWIDPDGVGVAAPHEVYCDMLTDGGGWALVSVSRSDDPDSSPFIGTAYCASLDTTLACKGRMPIAHVSTLNELLFLGLESGKWAVVSGFTATAESKIRFITGELPISTTSTWTRNGDTASDPSSSVVRTSGFTVNATLPLRHYIRNGGWWMGNGPLAGYVPGGRLIAINYGGTQDLSELLDPSAYSTPFPVEHMALFYR